MQANAQRLKEYRSSIVLFPRKNGKPKQGDSAQEELSAVAQHSGPILPIKHDQHKLETVAITDELKVPLLSSCATTHHPSWLFRIPCTLKVGV